MKGVEAVVRSPYTFENSINVIFFVTNMKTDFLLPEHMDECL